MRIQQELKSSIMVVFVSLMLLLPSFVQSQDTLLLGDKRVSYTPFGTENDSTIYILREDKGPSECDNVVVQDSLGRTLFRSFMKGDSCYNYDYFNDGTVRNFDLFKHEGDGFTSYVYNEQYCQNGQLIFKGRIAAMELKHDLTYYHCNGKVNIAFSRNGICNDKAYNVWYEDGQLKASGFYKDCERDGRWIELAENGDTLISDIYLNGIRVDSLRVLEDKSASFNIDSFLLKPFDLYAFKQTKNGSNSTGANFKGYHFKPTGGGVGYSFSCFVPKKLIHVHGEKAFYCKAGYVGTCKTCISYREDGLVIKTYQPKGKHQHDYVNPREYLIELVAKYNDFDLPELAFVALKKDAIVRKLGEPTFIKNNCLVYSSHRRVLILKLLYGDVKWIKYIHLSNDDLENPALYRLK